MNIFFRELKANLKSLLTWSGFLLLFVFLCSAKFSAFYNNPSILKMVDALPKAMLDGMSLRGFNLITLSGFFGVMFIYFALMGGIAAAMWASDSISKEERDKTRGELKAKMKANAEARDKKRAEDKSPAPKR